MVSAVSVTSNYFWWYMSREVLFNLLFTTNVRNQLVYSLLQNQICCEKIKHASCVFDTDRLYSSVGDCSFLTWAVVILPRYMTRI
jgi:hypothetical protein